ncbi:MAG: serine hydrolase domain-containing protein [Gemmatimonadota bacterium]
MYRRLAVFALLISSPAVAQDLTARLDSVMKASEKAGFSGVVRVERKGTVLLNKGYGFANRAQKIPFTPETVVQIGSNTKDFTAIAILQLQQAGRLALTDSIVKYFSNAPADKRAITIRQLMNHRAGFPLGIGPDFAPIGRKAFVDSAMRTELNFKPGTKEGYSNTGFSLLAAIIEQVTGKSYDEYVRDAILTPAGLKRTGFHLPGFKATELAHGYTASGDDHGTMLAKPHAADGPWWNLRGNGGMLSTVGDMHTFYKTLFETNTLMTAATRALRFDPNEPIGLAGSDGVNFFLYDRFPGMGMEIIIASTNGAVKSPAVRRALGAVLGMPNPDDGAEDAVASRPGGKPPAAAIATVLTELIATINTGDATKLRAFIAAHFASDAGSPTLAERVERFGKMHESLGALAIEKVETFDKGPIEMRVTTGDGPRATFLVDMESAAPYRIRGIQVRLGG